MVSRTCLNPSTGLGDTTWTRTKTAYDGAYLRISNPFPYQIRIMVPYCGYQVATYQTTTLCTKLASVYEARWRRKESNLFKPQPPYEEHRFIKENR